MEKEFNYSILFKQAIQKIKCIRNPHAANPEFSDMKWENESVSVKVNKTVTNNFSDNDSAITSNLNESKELPETLIINIVNNGFVNYRKNPLTTLYKVGSEVNVFYNPSNPHESYVERFIKPSKVYNLILIFSLISLIGAIILFII